MTAKAVELYSLAFGAGAVTFSLPTSAELLPVTEYSSMVGSNVCSLLFDVPVDDPRVDRHFKARFVGATPYAYDDIVEQAIGTAVQRGGNSLMNHFVVLEVF